MLPLEVSNLPTTANEITVYVNGRKTKLENDVFVKDKVLYVPVFEICEKLRIDKLDACKDQITYADHQSYLISKEGIRKIDHKNEDRLLRYDVKTINSISYIDALFFVRELGVAVTWENYTDCVYFASVPCFDGYMILPERFDKVASIMDDYGKFFCVKGEYITDIDETCTFSVSGCGFRRIILKNNVEKDMKAHSSHILCFQLEAIDKGNNVLYGRLLEVHKNGELENRLGSMAYTDTDWVQIYRKQQGLANRLDADGRINKEALYTVFSEYPFLLNDRNALCCWLQSLFPQNTRERNLLLAVYDNDIFYAIDKEDNLLDDCFIHDMVQQLIDNNGIDLKFAWETVCLCCDIYGKRIKCKEYVQKEKYGEKLQYLILKKEEQWTDLYDGPESYSCLEMLSIEDLELPTKTLNALKRAGILTPEDLVNMTSDKLMQVPNIGKKGYEAIVQVLDDIGVTLRVDPE